MHIYSEKDLLGAAEKYEKARADGRYVPPDTAFCKTDAVFPTEEEIQEAGKSLRSFVESELYLTALQLIKASGIHIILCEERAGIGCVLVTYLGENGFETSLEADAPSDPPIKGDVCSCSPEAAAQALLYPYGGRMPLRDGDHIPADAGHWLGRELIRIAIRPFGRPFR